jgi:hypothetical protein
MAEYRFDYKRSAGRFTESEAAGLPQHTELPVLYAGLETARAHLDNGYYYASLPDELIEALETERLNYTFNVVTEGDTDRSTAIVIYTP